MTVAKRQSLGIRDGGHEDAEHTLILKLNSDPLVYVCFVKRLVLVRVFAENCFARWDPPFESCCSVLA